MPDATHFDRGAADAALMDAEQAKALRVIPAPERLMVALRAALAEIDRLAKQAVREQDVLVRTIDERDRFHEIADQLASVLAPPEVLGEHSSGNHPWHNALEYVHPITDEMVEAAWRTYERIAPETFVMGHRIGNARKRMRAALEAAEAKR